MNLCWDLDGNKDKHNGKHNGIAHSETSDSLKTSFQILRNLRLKSLFLSNWLFFALKSVFFGRKKKKQKRNENHWTEPSAVSAPLSIGLHPTPPSLHWAPPWVERPGLEKLRRRSLNEAQRRFGGWKWIKMGENWDKTHGKSLEHPNLSIQIQLKLNMIGWFSQRFDGKMMV